MSEAVEADTTWWCKTVDGAIVEHKGNAYTGHAGHVRCVPVGEVPLRAEVDQ